MRCVLFSLAVFSAFPLSVTAEEAPSITAAGEHLQKGRHAEALEAFDEAAKQNADAARITIGRSRVHEELGEWKQATAILSDAAKSHTKNADVQARYAEVLFRQGRYEEAEQVAERALKLDGNHPRARLVLAHVLTETGRLKAALDGYVWFVRYYNRVQPEDAESLLLTADGALQYARWKSSSQIFRFALNTLCVDALKDDKNSWRSYRVSGDLLLEKYNRAQAIPEFKSALAINPRAADVHASLAAAALQNHELEDADKHANAALEINPKHQRALRLKADLHITAGRLPDALTAVKAALEVNPHEQRTLARRAAVYLLSDGPPDADELSRLLQRLDAIDQVKIEKPDRFTKLVMELAKWNPRPGYFLNDVGELLEGRRKFDLAEQFFRQAIASMPQLSEPKTNLGMLSMRIGKTDEAKRMLDDAFKQDPFHVRVSNMRKVLKVLDGYETIATDHFVIRVDSEQDKILGQYMAEYLEEIYPELTKQFGFEPPHRTHFEIYHDAKGLSAHQWFSARMVGLPWIQTIGASTGVIVALSSPTATDKPFNWARVLKHEFVHVITLQQTKFNIPHWFTEALAVTSEGGSPPDQWNELLLERVPKGDIRNLLTLNDGFIRPKSSDDWQFAYCQSRLYAQYMVEKFGAETIPKLLEAYRKNLTTEKAVPQVFGVELEEFEKGYRQHLDKLVAELQGGAPPEPLRSLAEIEKAHVADPDDPARAAAFAAVLLDVKQLDRARELAEKAVEKDKTEPKANLVLAKLELRARDSASAMAFLEAALDKEKPHKEVLSLLAKLKVLDLKYTEAEALYVLGQKKYPHDVTWLKGRAAIALKTDDNAALKPLLEELADREGDNLGIRKKLASLALEENRYADAVQHGREALHVDVMDAEVHRILGEAYSLNKDKKRAVRELQIAIQLDPEDAKAKRLLDEIQQ